MMKTNKLYIITNTINKKVYIGITTQTLNERWKSHLRDANNRVPFDLHRAIRKLGKENFEIRKICDCSSIDKMKELEIRFISKFDSFRNGYNMTPGGDGCSGYWE